MAGGVIATIYAASYPAAGVVNVDQPLQVEPFARLVRSLAGPLRGPGFAQVWEQFEASMGIGLLPPGTQDLLQSARYARQDGYGLLARGARRAARRAGPQDRGWPGRRAGRRRRPIRSWPATTRARSTWAGRKRELPQAEVTIWPDSGHFPHLAQPGRFAELLAATARWA